MAGWTGKWDDLSFLGFLERLHKDIHARLKTGSLASREAAAAEADELKAFVQLLTRIVEPNELLRDVDLFVDPKVQLKVASHGRFKAFYLILEPERLLYGAVVTRGDEAGVIARLDEIAGTLIAGATPPPPSTGGGK